MTYIAHEQNGYFCKDVRVEVASRLRYMPYAQAGWLREQDNYFTMVSYSSRIFTAQVTAFGVEEVNVNNADAAINYSRSTSRQVTAAMQELGLCGGEIAALKRFFIRGGKVACSGSDSWWDADTGAVIWEGVRG